MSKKEVKEAEELIPIPEQPKRQQSNTIMDIVLELIQKSPNPLKEILDALAVVLRGHPEEIKADYKLTAWTTAGFFVLMIAILIATSALSLAGNLSGDAVAFIFGTAFGSIITFMYRYLSPNKED